MILALNCECYELFIVKLLDSRRRLSPDIQVNEQDAISKGVDDEGFHWLCMVISNEAKDETQ